MHQFRVLIVKFLLISVCFCEVSFEKKDKFVEAFVENLNSLPDRSVVYGEGELLNIVENGENTYIIEVKVRASNNENVYVAKHLNCSGVITEDAEQGVVVHSPICSDYVDTTTDNLEEFVTDYATDRGPIQLDNEVQPNNAYTSGEQFIAVPRDRPAPCIGCSTQVDPQAPGVTELARLGLRQLDRHEPNTRHALNQVFTVERQVQVVGGIRYILTLAVDYNNCTATDTEGCYFQKVCKVNILEKPWQKLPDGTKFRAIASNNCTEEWIFGDNGEPTPIDGNYYTGPQNTTGSTDDEIKVVHASEVQALPATERTLTDTQVKEIEDQIIPVSQLSQPPQTSFQTDTGPVQSSADKKEHAANLDAARPASNDASATPNSDQAIISSLGDDKKKAIDDLLNFFDFSGYNTKSGDEIGDNTRIKRDYGSDLQILSLAENFQSLRNKIGNAKFIHSLAKAVVNHVNEMDIEIKTRSLVAVTSAEEEFENDQRFFYIQALVEVPCKDKAACKGKNKEETCNGIVELENNNEPTIIYTFCYEDNHKRVGKFKNVQTDDPVLLRLVKEALRKIDSESKSSKAFRIKQIRNPLTQTASGILTKFVLELETVDCEKKVPLFKRVQCSLLDYMGSKICDVEIYQKFKSKEKKIVYTCEDRPIDEVLDGSLTAIKADDKQVLEIVQEALRYLEIKSNKNNKQKLIEVKSAVKQLVEGTLTKVNFTVAYTDCSDDFKGTIDDCKLLEKEPLRNCKVEEWVRPWLEDGREVTVTCDDTATVIDNNDMSNIKVQKEDVLDNTRRIQRNIETSDREVEQNPRSSEYRMLAEEALAHYLLTYQYQQHYTILDVEKVTTSNSGRSTKIQFTSVPTNCKMSNGVPTSSQCVVQSAGETMSCLAEIMKNPELNSKMLKVNCQIDDKKVRRKRETEYVLLGGRTPQDPNNPKFEQLAKESTAKYLLSSGLTQYHKVINIEKVETQVVSGSKTYIDYKISPTTCLVDSDGSPTSDKCEIINPVNVLYCHSEIWEQSWLNRKQIDVNCTNVQSRRKRQEIVGGLTPQEKDNPEYKQLAQESAEKHVLTCGLKNYHKVVEMEEVTTQVVAGTLTRLDFKISPTKCLIDGNEPPTVANCEVLDPAKTLKCHSEIWERKWLNDKQINVTCTDVQSRRRRGLPGGIKTQDKDNPEYKQLAQESAEKHVLTCGLKNHHKVVEMEEVTTQVVAGTLTRLDFKISPTKCLVDGNEPPTVANCEVLDPAKILKCHSEIWERKWLNDKQINVTCTDVQSRRKRGLPGGIKTQDKDKPEYKQLAQESAEKHVLTCGLKNHHKVVEMEEVTTQVVAGTLTRLDFKISPTKCLVDGNEPPTVANCEVLDPAKILKCHSEIWERKWLNDKQINVTCTDVQSRRKRGLPGGIKTQDKDKPEYKQLAQESAEKHVLTCGLKNHHKVVEMEEVTTQVVAGTLTRLDFKISPTKCLVNGNEPPTVANCEVLDPAKILKCHSEIWEQPWLNDKRINVTCTDVQSRRKRGLPGGIKTQDKDKPEYKQLAQESAEKHVLTSGLKNHHKVVEMEEVTTQVVAGTLTRLDFKISPTKCLVDSIESSTDINNCEILDPANVLKCHSEIWERKWLNDKQINVTCSDIHSRKKRRVHDSGLVGGSEEQDTINDATYKQLAKDSLTKYLLKAKKSEEHEVIDIQKVSTQVIAGIRTIIEFTAAPKTCSTDVSSPQCEHKVLNCRSDIIEQPWRKVKDIKVNCGRKIKRREIKDGGLYEVDKNDPEYKTLAEESAAKYVLSSGLSQHHVVVEIEKVRKQVVSGFNTYIDFKISPTDCKVDGNGFPTSTNCKITDPSKILKCHSVTWEQAWLNKKEITTLDCKEVAPLSRRRVPPGGTYEVDKNDPEYKSLAEESTAKYVVSSGLSQHHTVVEIEKVGKQVVSGVNVYIDFKISPTDCNVDSNGLPTSTNCKITDPSKILKCHSVTWIQSWLNKKEITTLDCKEIQTRREGSEQQDLNNPKFKQLAQHSLTKYLFKTNEVEKHKVLQIQKIVTQTVPGGIKTIIEFTAAPTKCLNNPYDNCDTEILSCTSKAFLDQEWFEKELSVDCHQKIEKRDVMNLSLNRQSRRQGMRSGGEQEQDPKKDEYKDLALESLRKYQLQEKSAYRHKLISVKRVTTKVVSGLMYKIDFTASPTTCLLNVTNFNKCRVQEVVLYCHTEIWNRPWLKRKTITVFCNEGDSSEDDDTVVESTTKVRRKRSNTPIELSPNDERVRRLARDSFSDYLNSSGIQEKHRVSKIDRATREGELFEIDYTAVPIRCLTNEVKAMGDCDGTNLKCEAKILEKEGIGETKYKVDCSNSLSENDLIQPSDNEIEAPKNNNEPELLNPAEALTTECQSFKSNTTCFSNKRRKRRNLLLNDFGGLNRLLRGKRQIPMDDEYIDDELKYYYADRVLSQINQQTDTENLYKIITIHDIRRSVHMKTLMVRMYLEVAMTYCLRHGEESDLNACSEIDGTRHKICYGRLWPSRDDELIVGIVNVVCEDDLRKFATITGINRHDLVLASVSVLNHSPSYSHYVMSFGETRVIPSLDSSDPLKLNFLIAHTNCTKNDDPAKVKCVIDVSRNAKSCQSLIYFSPNTRALKAVNVSCFIEPLRKRRSITLDPVNATSEDIRIQELVQESLEKLESISVHRYKQRVLLINSYTSKVTTGKQTTIDFDVGYTNCLKYEWVDNITSCEFLEHLPRRHCVSQIYERLWVNNGKEIVVSCDDDETPLEANMEFESAEGAMALANEALKRIEYKYPHARKQKVVRIFTLEKQMVAGMHYRMKMEVGYTDCMALSVEENCKLVSDLGLNKFCRVNVWLRLWTNHPPSFRVTCDYNDGASDEIYHQLQAEQLFSHFVSTHRPAYMNDNVEMQRRFGIFKANVKKIHELNIYEQGTARYAVTQFADLSPEEFRRRYLGLDPKLRDENQVPMPAAEIPPVRVPAEFDWREHGAVTEVKNQGSCGSCWAFSVTGNIEGQWKKHTGKLVSLSEQELVDCDTLDKGCNGGLPDNAYRAIEQLGGLEAETDYPYEGEDDKCAFNASMSRVQISGAVNITSNETAMAQWLVENGPISIGINANAMQFYVGGISHPWRMLCNPKNLDHGVLIVGYGEKDYPLFNKKLPYWIVKNSWGSSWGEQGYYRVYRGDGTCGVNQMASSAVI